MKFVALVYLEEEKLRAVPDSECMDCGNGALKGSQHVEPSSPTPLANLHMTILEKVGFPQKSFGDSTGSIAGV